jgi:hypothetical protein
MSLEEQIACLEEPKRLQLAADLLELALPVWMNFTENPSSLFYYHALGDGIVARNIIQRTINVAKDGVDSVDRKKEIEKLFTEFIEPVLAIRDDYWILPEDVKLIVWAASNLVDKLAGESITRVGEDQLYLVINQEVDALTKANRITFDEVNVMIREYFSPRN